MTSGFPLKCVSKHESGVQEQLWYMWMVVQVR